MLLVQDKGEDPTWIARIRGITENRDTTPMKVSVSTIHNEQGEAPSDIVAQATLLFTRGEGSGGTVRSLGVLEEFESGQEPWA